MRREIGEVSKRHFNKFETNKERIREVISQLITIQNELETLLNKNYRKIYVSLELACDGVGLCAKDYYGDNEMYVKPALVSIHIDLSDITNLVSYIKKPMGLSIKDRERIRSIISRLPGIINTLQKWKGKMNNSVGST